MSEVDVHAPFMGYSGTLGKIVYRKYKGKVIASLRPKGKRTQTEAQMEHHKRFRKANSYARMTMADSSKREYYEQRARELDKPLFALIMGDYLKPPFVEEWDLAEYGGKAGDPIVVTARDNVGVVDVTIHITDEQGGAIEAGKAVAALSGTGVWVYTAQSNVPPGKTVNIEAVATDRPGGTGVSTTTKTV